MEVVLIRHGEPEWVRDGTTVDDPPLTDRGHEQARRLAERLRGTHFDDLFVSPLVRAQQTAGPVIDAVGLDPTTLPWLAEIASPDWTGTPAETVERIFAEGRARPLDQQWEGIPGGESFRDFHDRVCGGLREMLDGVGAVQVSEFPPLWKLLDPGRRVLVVAHSGTNATALGHLLGIAPVPWEWERFWTLHASISRVQPMEISGAHSFSLSRLSDVEHLPPEMQSR